MINNKRVLSVITARAGSVGVPGKNFKQLNGIPLFWWSVMASLNSKYIDKTIISSNCDCCEKVFNDKSEFLNRKKALEWIQRPDELSGDLSKNEDALIHVLEKLEEKYDIVVNLQPTSPCRLFSILDDCIKTYHDYGHDSLLTATEITPFLWQKKDGKWVYNIDRNDCCNRKMRQEFEDDRYNSEFIFHDNGSIYIVDVGVLLETRCRIGSNPCVFKTSGLNSFQIDTEFDFQFIEQMAVIRN